MHVAGGRWHRCGEGRAGDCPVGVAGAGEIGCDFALEDSGEGVGVVWRFEGRVGRVVELGGVAKSKSRRRERFWSLGWGRLGFESTWG